MRAGGRAGTTHLNAATAPLVSCSVSMSPADWSSSNRLISLHTARMGVCVSRRARTVDGRAGAGRLVRARRGGGGPLRPQPPRRRGLRHELPSLWGCSLPAFAWVSDAPTLNLKRESRGRQM